MEILGIGPLEALFILILALIFVGPKDLSSYARSLGRALNRLYRSEAWHAVAEASRNLRTLPNRLAREAALDELDQARGEIDAAGQGIRDQLREVKTAMQPDAPQGSPPGPEVNEAGGEGEPISSDP